ncbi:MAG: hypothetical protein KJ583_01590 [Nanoarchaeota archaeon]|nr:hypothetical protein [Nanoarchaeota archaeon]MBU1269161.1 hypothetical protein [Nanoarchaeota archaeon]MBU1603986.1 hypothetical protein [Nanoarchaeota archaeon]MBU2443871.1 hypothetical protein [Nanoarchaeota archaeon]
MSEQGYEIYKTKPDENQKFPHIVLDQVGVKFYDGPNNSGETGGYCHPNSDREPDQLAKIIDTIVYDRLLKRTNLKNSPINSIKVFLEDPSWDETATKLLELNDSRAFSTSRKS